MNTQPTRFCIIGTAGRKEDGKRLRAVGGPVMFAAMVDVALSEAAAITAETGQTRWLVSGGAAWADHVAVRLFLDSDASHHPLAGKIAGRRLHLPSQPRDGRFCENPARGGWDPARITTSYHDRFARDAGLDPFGEIRRALERGAQAVVTPNFKDS